MYPHPSTPYMDQFSVYTHTFASKNISYVENGNKIVLPNEALIKLLTLRIVTPYYFRITNANKKVKANCGVLEFSAPPGMCYLPLWMMTILKLDQGDIIILTSMNFPKGTSIHIKPHVQQFLELSNPKAVLEKVLLNFSCLTKKETISIIYNEISYYLTIEDCKPEDAISIINADLNIEFTLPEGNSELLNSLDSNFNSDKISSKINNDSNVNLIVKAKSEIINDINKNKNKNKNKNSVSIIAPNKKKIELYNIKGETKLMEDMASQEESQNEIYDPRKYKLLHGIRNTNPQQSIILGNYSSKNNSKTSFQPFSGIGIKIGK